MNFQIKDRISHYRLIEKLGEGGMGVVYKAEDPRLGRLVAIKLLQPALLEDETAYKRFISEARAASALDHPNICTIYEIDRAEGQMFIAMAYYEGETLREKLAHSPLPVKEAISIARQIGLGLAKAHDQGILHRDIKPANILVQPDGVIKIIDFGLSKLRHSATLTQSGAMLGTAAYMSPEQVASKPLDERTDIWSLGVLFYEMLSGQEPFKGEHQLGYLYSIMNTEPQPLSEICPGLPPYLETIIHKMLEKDPEERYRQISEFLNDLDRLPSESPLPASVTSTFKPPIGLKKLYVPVLIAAFILLAGFVGQSIFSTFNTTSQLPSSAVERILIFPFKTQGDKDLLPYQRSLDDLLSGRITDAGRLKRIDPRIVRESLVAFDDRQLTLVSAKRVAKRLSADRFMLGDVYKIGDQIQVTGTLYAMDDSEPISIQSKTVSIEDMVTVIDDLAIQILQSLIAGNKNYIQRIASTSAKTPQALKAFLDGEAFSRAGNYTPACDAYEAAIAADTTFALAYYRLAFTRFINPHRFNDYLDAINKALHYGQSLNARERELIRAFHHYDNRRIDEAEAIYTEILSAYPDDRDTHVMLAFMAFNFGSRRGKTATSMLQTAQKALEIDPNNPILYGIMNAFAGLDEDFSDLPLYPQKRLQLAHSGTYRRSDSMLIAFSTGDSIAQKQVLEEIKRTGSLPFPFIKNLINTEHFDGADLLLRKLFETANPQQKNDIYFTNLYRSLALGQVTKTEMLIDSLFQYNAIGLLSELPHVFAHPDMAFSEKEWHSLITRMAAWDNQSKFFDLFYYYLIGHYHAANAHFNLASQYADSLLFLSQDTTFHPAAKQGAADYRASVLGHIYYQQAHYEKALHALKSLATPRKWWHVLPADMAQSQLLERYLRIKSLIALERYDEALKWLSVFGYAPMVEVTYRAQKHLLRAEIFIKKGQPDKAVENYQRVLELWENCDSKLQPLVEDIQRKIIELKKQ